MAEVPSELRDEIPSFEEAAPHQEHGPLDWSALTSIRTAKSTGACLSLWLATGRRLRRKSWGPCCIFLPAP